MNEVWSPLDVAKAPCAGAEVQADCGVERVGSCESTEVALRVLF